MDRLLVVLIVATLLTLGALGVCLITRSAKPRTLKRWGIYAIIGLIGLSLGTPVAFGREYKRPESGAISIITCDVKDRNSYFVAQAITEQNPELFNDIGEKCHLPADGALIPQDCALFTNNSNNSLPYPIRYYVPTLTPCFKDTPVVRFAIFDPLGPEQVSELADIWLGDRHAESMFINQAMPGELLIISVPKADVYNYTLKLNSYYDTGVCSAPGERTKQATLNVRNGSFFVATEEDCQSKKIWLDDWTPLSN